MASNSHHGSFSERLPDGRVLIASYVRIDRQVYLRMTAYDAQGKETKYLDMDMRLEPEGKALEGAGDA